jgi:hypothetical protein
MKPRHAAALALVGWYLIVPPKSCKRAELDANFSLWKIYNSYDTAAQCRAARDDLQRIWGVDVLTLSEVLKRSDAAAAQAVKVAQCLASDDLRLKP